MRRLLCMCIDTVDDRVAAEQDERINVECFGKPLHDGERRRCLCL